MKDCDGSLCWSAGNVPIPALAVAMLRTVDSVKLMIILT